MPEQSNQSNSALFSRSRHNNKVRPFSAGAAESDLVEIRPNRFLRIQHINAQPRDEKFEKEMQMQMQYKKRGIITGPLSMPKRKPVREASTVNVKDSAHEATSLPNSVDDKHSVTSNYREISASGSKAHFTSPSNVLVAMENADSKIVSTSENKSIEEELEEGDHSPNQKSTTETDGQTQTKTKDSEQNSSAVDPVETRPKSDRKTPAASVKTTPHTTPRAQGEQKAGAQRASISNSMLESPRIRSTALFFFHGVGGSSDVWQAQIKHFAKEGYEIIAPDMIGHGMSCTPTDAKSYHFLEIAADMEDVFDKYCKKKNIVVGHSYGCSFAVVMARRRSRRVQKLVLISGGAPTPLAPQPGLFTLPKCVLGCLRPCLNHGFQRSAFHKKRQPVVDKEEAFSIPTYVLHHTMNGQDWPDGDEVYHQWLLCSTLLLYGAQDKLVTLKEEKQMEEVIFRSRLEVIPDASHMVMIEAPDEVNSFLQEFFVEDSTLTTQNTSPVPPAPAPDPAPAQRPSLERSVSRVSMKSTKSHKAMPNHCS